MIEEVIDVRPNLTFSNNTNTTQTVIIDPHPIYEKSTFVPDDINTYTIVDSTKLISVPLQIDRANVSLGERKWNYSARESSVLTNLNFKDSVVVDPKKRLSASLTVIYTKIKTAYTLEIKNINNDQIVRVKGLWVGIYPVNTKSLINITDL